MLGKIEWQHPLFYLPLFFMLFPILGVFGLGYPLWTLLPSLLFAVAYLYLVHGRENLWTNVIWTYMLVYVVYMTIWVNGGMMWFLFYFNSLIVYRFQDKLKNYRFLSLILGTTIIVVLGLIYGDDLGSRIMVVLLPIVIFTLLFFWASEREKEEQQRLIAEKNQSINLLLADNERNRIGQDLHDTLGHVFAMMSVKSELALALIENGAIEKARKEIAELNDITKTSMQEVRQIVQDLRQHTLEEELTILSNMLELAQVELLVEGREMLESVSLTQQDMLSMMLRELTNNLLKHSRASQCRICFVKDTQEFQVIFEDNGQGFSKLDGTELHSLRDRMIRLQGSLEITSQKAPTQIRLTIPLEKESRR